MNGIKVFEKRLINSGDQMTLSLPQFPSGMYIIELKTATKIQRQYLMIQR